MFTFHQHTLHFKLGSRFRNFFFRSLSDPDNLEASVNNALETCEKNIEIEGHVYTRQDNSHGFELNSSHSF